MSEQRKNSFCSRGIKEAVTGLLPQRVLIPLGILMKWLQLWMDALIAGALTTPLTSELCWQDFSYCYLLTRLSAFCPLAGSSPDQPVSPKLLHRA